MYIFSKYLHAYINLNYIEILYFFLCVCVYEYKININSADIYY